MNYLLLSGREWQWWWSLNLMACPQLCATLYPPRLTTAGWKCASCGTCCSKIASCKYNIEDCKIGNILTPTPPGVHSVHPNPLTVALHYYYHLNMVLIFKSYNRFWTFLASWGQTWGLPLPIIEKSSKAPQHIWHNTGLSENIEGALQEKWQWWKVH